MGAVTDVVRRQVPGSYRAMVTTTNPYYGIADLQSLADYVQFRLFASVIGATEEATTFDPLLTEFIGTLTTLQFIPAAVDYWGDQLIQESTTGTNETVTFPDRRDSGLWKIFDQLKAEVAAEYDAMAETYGFIIRGSASVIPRVSYGDNGRRVMISMDPRAIGRIHDRGHRHSNGLDWRLA